MNHATRYPSAIERSKRSVAAFKQAQALRERDPRFAEVVKAKQRLQYVRHLLVDLENTKDMMLDIAPERYAMEKSIRKHEVTFYQQQLVEAEQQASFLGSVAAPSKGDRDWVVSYYIDGFTTRTYGERRFAKLQEATAFAEALKTRIGVPVAHIDVLA